MIFGYPLLNNGYPKSTWFMDIQKSIYGYPKIDLWISKIQLDFWISIIRFSVSNIQPYLWISKIDSQTRRLANLQTHKLADSQTRKLATRSSHITHTRAMGVWVMCELRVSELAVYFPSLKNCEQRELVIWANSTVKPQNDKSNKMTMHIQRWLNSIGASSLRRSLIRRFNITREKKWILSYSYSSKWWLVRLHSCAGYAES